MTPIPNPTSQAGSSISTRHAFFAPRSQSRNENSTETQNAEENITTEDTSNSSDSENLIINANSDQIEEAMNYIGPHQAHSTANNRSRAVTVFDEFALKHSNPTFEVIKMPVTNEEMCSFKKILEGFSNFLVHEATQMNKEERYEPGTAAGYFSSLYNALQKKDGWGMFVTPPWYQGMNTKIKDALTKMAADQGKITSDLLDRKKAITRTPFKNALEALLGNSTARTAVKNWQRW